MAGSLLEWTSTLDRPLPLPAEDGREDLTAPGERVVRGGNHVFDDAPERLDDLEPDGVVAKSGNRAPPNWISLRCRRVSCIRQVRGYGNVS